MNNQVITIKKLFSGLLMLLCLLATCRMNAQQSKILIKGIKVKKLNINFDAQPKTVSYLNLEDGTAAPREITKEQTFSLTDNYANLNFRWKNSLQYKFTWKDSVYANEQQAALKDFFKMLTPLFNIPDATSAASNSAAMKNAQEDARVASTQITPPEGGFKDYDLTFLYVQLIYAKDEITEVERATINSFTLKLKKLENGDIDYQAKAKESFKKMFDVTNPANVTNDKDGVADKEKANVDGWITAVNNNVKLREQLSTELEAIKIAKEPYNSLFQQGVKKYLEKSKSISNTNLAVLKKLTPVIELLKSSVKEPNAPFAYGNLQDLTRVRTVKLEEGKVLQTELAVTKFKISDDGFTLEKESEFEKVKFTFRDYDPFSFFVSTGVFYGSTSIRGYGTGTSGTDMVVTEDTLKSNTAVAAVFGNFAFSVGSKLLAPTIQLGIDPTKKHPFFLFGGGLVFPSIHLAFTAGGIWTFEPTLNKLKTGQKITSTTDLEKDIKNNFQLNPKGWYFGVQYNF